MLLMCCPVGQARVFRLLVWGFESQRIQQVATERSMGIEEGRVLLRMSRVLRRMGTMALRRGFGLMRQQWLLAQATLNTYRTHNGADCLDAVAGHEGCRTARSAATDPAAAVSGMPDHAGSAASMGNTTRPQRDQLDAMQLGASTHRGEIRTLPGCPHSWIPHDA